jgi:Gpi18-like mannosyltransferase
LGRLALVLALGTVVQLLIATQTGHESDLIQFQRWAYDLAHRDPWNVLQGPEFNIDHLPGFLLYLWAVGEAYEQFTFTQSEYLFILKLPAVAANIIGAALLYFLLRDRREFVRLTATAVYLFLPTALLIGPLWGQTDAVGAMFLLLTIFLFDRDRPIWAAIAFTLGFFVKAQIAAALPVFVFWGIRNYPRDVWWKCAIAGGAVALALTLIFFPANPWEIFEHIRKGTEVFDFNASFTFNFWSMFGWFRSDSITYMGIDWRTWGILMLFVANVLILLSIRRATDTAALALAVSLAMLALYVLLTRVHERYMFAAFLPLLAACFLTNSRILWSLFVALTVLHFFSLYRSFFHSFFNPGEPAILYDDWIIRAIDWSPDWWRRPGSFVAVVASAFTVIFFLIMLAYSAVRNSALPFASSRRGSTDDIAPAS